MSLLFYNYSPKVTFINIRKIAVTEARRNEIFFALYVIRLIRTVRVGSVGDRNTHFKELAQKLGVLM